MFKTFVKGLVFGSGFSIALIAFGFVVSFYIKDSGNIETHQVYSDVGEWQSLTDEEKITHASAVAIIRYSDGEEGQRLATIANVYKRNQDIVINHEAGEPWPSANYYPRYQHDDRTGAVVLYKGSPAKALSTWYMYGERISTLGDMPLELFIKKFNEGV